MQCANSDDLRFEMRSNIFVMATLHATGHPAIPVRVRNLSRTGALIEAAFLPPPATQIRLTRASLTALGTIMWVGGAKGGLKFAEPVAVTDWLPQGKRGSGQQFVDELFHQQRLGGTDVMALDRGKSRPNVADELLQLKLSLERAAEALALDEAVAQRHLVSLQAIDGIAQALARLAVDAVVQQTEPSVVR